MYANEGDVRSEFMTNDIATGAEYRNLLITTRKREHRTLF